MSEILMREVRAEVERALAARDIAFTGVFPGPRSNEISFTTTTGVTGVVIVRVRDPEHG